MRREGFKSVPQRLKAARLSDFKLARVELVPFPVIFYKGFSFWEETIQIEEVMSTETCYACEQTASTLEHCPPKSFFPEGQRNQLLTVPSCPQHNNDNSKDVEYVRAAITILRGVNESGLELLRGPVLRSLLNRSPKLLTTTFSTMQPVFYEGQTTGAFRLDLKRLENIFEACARAIHYHETQKKHKDWAIVMPHLLLGPEASDVVKHENASLCEKLQRTGFVRKSVGNPDVFEYGTAQSADGYQVYCFFFYQSFIVYAFPIPDSQKNEWDLTKQELTAKG